MARQTFEKQGRVSAVMSPGMLFVVVFCHFLWTTAVAVNQSSPADDEGLCATCSREDADPSVSDEDLRKARIEYVMNTILEKLRMSAPPQVTKPPIPDILLEGHLLDVYRGVDDQNVQSEDLSNDDFYGITEEIVIFPDNTSSHNCYTKNETHPNSCFRFRLTPDVTTDSLAFADLWVYKTGNLNDSDATNLSYTVLEVTQDPTEGESYTKRFVAFRDTPGTSGWLKFEIGSVVRLWVEQNNATHALEIICTGCESAMETPVATDDSRKPFIVVHIDSKNTRPRSKREVAECEEGMSRCCKEKLEFSFVDVGWDQWIITPLEYNGSFCRGKCAREIGSGYQHTTMKQTYINSNIQSKPTLQLCCTPSKMKALNILYLDENEVPTKSILQDMIVENCKCA